jgi:hypothetical protein
MSRRNKPFQASSEKRIVVLLADLIDACLPQFGRSPGISSSSSRATMHWPFIYGKCACLVTVWMKNTDDQSQL